MGLHRRVNLTLVIIAFTQIACRHCMPRIPGKATLKRYLNDLNPVKTHPVQTPYSTSRANPTLKQTFGKKAQNGKISQNTFPTESLYKTYNFPENEYPLDNSPRDPFRTSMNFNHNNHVGTLQKTHNVQSTAINDLKKEMKIKRKLLSNKQINIENSQLKSDLPTIKLASYPDSIRLFDSESFPDVQYPLNSMDTWGSNYWNYLPFTQEKQFNVFGQQVLNFKSKEEASKPLTKLTKTKARQYLESFDKLKEEQRRTSTENSKRSNVGQKGLNFTKTVTCESVSDDFMTAGLVSNIPSNSTETKNIFVPTTEISSENVCPVSEYLNNSVPIPYRVIENQNENLCPTFELKNNTKELLDLDTSVLAQTLHLIEEILLFDDTSSVVSTGNYSKAIEGNVDSSHCTDFSVNEDKPSMLNDSAKSCTDCSSAEKLSQEVPDDTSAVVLQYQTPSLQDEKIQQNITNVSGPLNVEMPLPFTEPIRNETCPYVTSSGQSFVAMPKSHADSGTTSIFIIPIDNNSIGKLQSQTTETTSGKQIILYLPFTQNSGIPSQTHNQIVSSSLDNSVPNNELYNVLSKMAPIQNDNPSTALVSELLNSVSDSGSSWPMYDTLPTNSMCYNNESSPSSMKEKPISDIPLHKSMTDDAPLITTIYDEQLSQQSIETGNFGLNTETLPQNTDFAHPLFDFAGGEFTSLSLGPYDNGHINELPILAREINSVQQFSDVSSKDLFIPTENVISKDNNMYYNDLPSIKNGALTAGDPRSSTGIITDEIPPTPLIDTTVKQPVPLKTSLTSLSEIFSDQLPERVDMQLPQKSSVTMDTSSLPPINNNSPMTPDMSVKMELYKIRQILDKMLTSETLTDSLTTPVEQMSSPISNADSIPNHMHKSLEPCQTLTDRDSLPTVDKTVLPLSAIDSPLHQIENLQPQKHEPLLYGRIDGTPSEILSLPRDNSSITNLFIDTTDSPLVLIDVTNPPAPIFKTDTDYKPFLIDNLVTSLSKTRTDLSRTIEDVPSKIGVVIPNIIEVPSDDVLTAVSNLPIIVPQEHAHINNKSKNSSMQVVESQKPLFEDLVRDLLYDTKTLPTAKVIEAELPDILSESHTTATNCYTDKRQQNISPSPVPMTEGDNKQKKYSTISANQDVNLSDLPIDQPSLSNNSTSPINDNVSEVSYNYSHIKDLLLVLDSLLSPKDDSRPDIMVTDILTPVSQSLKNNLQSDNQDKTSNETQSEYTLSDIPFHDLTLSEEKLLPLLKAKQMLQENKIFPKIKVSANLPTSEKVEDTFPLGVNKTHLVASVLGIPENLSLKIDETCTDEPDILTDDIETQNKTEALSHIILHNASVDVLLPKNEVSLQLNTLDNTSLSHKSIPSASKLPITKALLENILSDLSTKGFSLPVSKVLPVKSFSVLNKPVFNLESAHSDFTEDSPLPSVNEIIYNATLDDHPNDNVLPISGKSEYNLPLREDKTISDVLSSDNLLELKSLIDKELLFSNVDLTTPKPGGLPKDTLHDLPVPNTESLSSSKLLITKVLLENVLSDLSTKGFSLPVSKVLPVKSFSVLNKTVFNLESTHSDFNEDSPLPSVNEIIYNATLDDHPKDNILPISGKSEYTLPLREDKTISDVLSSDNLLELKSLIDKELLFSNVDLTTPKPGGLPKHTLHDLPVSNTESLSSSKLLITKVLLENVLSEMNQNRFSLPVKKPLSVDHTTSHSELDKTLYFIESTLSDMIEQSSQEKVPYSATNEDVFELCLEKICPDNPNFDMPADDYPTEQTIKQSYNLIEQIGDEDSKTTLSDKSVDDAGAVPTLIDKALPHSNIDVISLKPKNLPKDKPSNLPLLENKPLSSSKLPITKALPSLCLDTTDSPLLLIDVTNPPAPIFETDTDYKPYLIDNLVTSLSGTRTDVSRTIEDVPSKIGVVIPNIIEVLSDDVPTAVSNLPIIVPQEHAHINNKSNNSSMQVVESQKPLFEDLVRDPLYDTNTLLTEKVLEAGLPDILSKSHTTATNCYTDKQQYNISPSPVPMTEGDKKQKNDSTISANQDVNLSDLPIDQPSLSNNSTSPINDNVSEVSYNYSHIKDLLLVLDSLLSPKDDSRTDIMVTDNLAPVSQSLKNNLQSDNQDKTSNETQSEYTLSDIPFHDLTLSEEKLLPLLKAKQMLQENKIFPKIKVSANLPTSEKVENTFPLGVKKTHLVASVLGIPENLSLKIDETCTDEPDILTDDIETQNKTEALSHIILHNASVDVLSPKNEVSLQLNTLDNTSLSHKSIPSASKLPITKALLENILSDLSTKGFSLPVSKVLPVKSFSVLNKTVFNLESTHSDFTEDSPLPPVNEIIYNATLDDHPKDNVLPISGKSEYTLPLREDKTISDVLSSDNLLELKSLIDKELLFSNVDLTTPKPGGLPKDTLHDLPVPNTESLSSSKLLITKVLLENVLSDLSTKGFSLPVSKVLPVKSFSVLNKTVFNLESTHSDFNEDSPLPSVNEIIYNATLDDHPKDNVLPISGKSEYTLPLREDKTISDVLSSDNLLELKSLIDKELLFSNVDLTTPKPGGLPKDTLHDLPVPNTESLSSSKLLITKVLLENVLSDLSTKGFSLPVSKVLPVKSFSVLNKTVFNLESTDSDFNEDSPLPSVNEIIYNATLDDHPKDNVLPISGKSEYTLPLREDKTISDVLSSDNLLELKSLIDKELLFSNVDLTTPKPGGLPKDTLHDLPVPNTESLSSSKLLITKVLLENVLSEMNQNRFSLPVKKPLSVDHTTSHSELDKTLYFIESTLSDMIEQSSQEKVPYSATNEDVFELCLEKICPDNPNFDMPADDYPTEQTIKKQSYNLIEQIGDEDSKTTLSDKSVDDAGGVLTLIDKALPHSNIDVISLKPKNLPKDKPSNLPLLENKPLSSSKLPITKALPSLCLDTTDSPLLLIDVTNPPAPIFETDTDYKPYLIDNLVTSLSGTRTDVSRTIEDVPSKIGVVIPNIIEVPSDDVPTAVSNLPIIVPQEHAHINNKSNNSSMQVVESQKPLSEDLVRDLLYDTNTLPTEKVMEAGLPNILSESHTTATNCYSDKPQHNILPSPVPMTEGDKKQKNYLTLSANRDVHHSDLPIDQSSLSNNSTSPTNENVSEVSYSYSDTKDRPLVLDSLLSPNDDSRPDIMVTDILTPVSPSLKNNLQSDNQDKTSNETQSEYTLSDIPFHDLTLSEENLLPLLEAKQMLQENMIFPKIKDSANLPTSEKVEDTFPLRVNKTHLVTSVLGIPENLSLEIDETCTDEPDILTDDIETQNKTEALSHIILHNASVDVLSPKNEVSLQLNTLDNTSLSHKSIPSASKLPITKALLENILSDLSTKGFSLPVSKVLPVKSFSVLNKTVYNLESTHSDFAEDSPLPSVNEILYNATLDDHPKDNVLPISGKSEYDLPLKEDKTISDVLSSDNLLELKSLIDKELPFSNVDLTTPKSEGLPKDTLNDLPVPNTESLSSSELLITKVLLENVLSEINQNNFSLPVKKSLSHSELDKTLYFIESTLSDMIEQSSQEEVPYSATNEDVFELCLEKIFPDNPNFDMPADDYPTEQTTKKQSYNLIEQIGDKESKTTFTEKSVDDAGAVPTLIDKALPHSNIDVISLKPKNLPKDTPSNLPLLENKPLSSSKLPISKALPSLFLDTTDSPLLLIDVTNPPAPIFETDTDYKPYLIDNLVTSLSGTRTDVSRTIEDVPSKIGVVIPNIIEVLSDDVPTAVSNLPIIVPQEHAHINNKSNNSSMQVVESQKPLSEDLVRDLLYDTNTLPTEKVMEAGLPDILSESHTTATNCYSDKPQHNISPSPVPMTEGDKKQKNDSTISANEDVNLSDLPIDQPSLSNNSTFPTNDNVSEVSYSYSDTKDLPLVLDSLLSPKDDSRPDIMVTDILTPVSPSLKNNLKSDNQDKTSNETQSEYTLSDIPFHDLTLSEENLLPLLEAKQMLQENKIFPKIKDSANLPTSEKVEDTFPLRVNKTHLVTSVLGIPENLSLEIDETCTDEPDILTDDIETQNKTEALSHIILHNASVDVLSPKNEVSLQLNTLDNTSLSHKSIPSASKLPITKALLENILSDLSTKGFSLPVSKVLPVKSFSVLNKTVYNLESTHSDFAEDSPLPSVNEIIYNATLDDHPKDNVLPISGKSEYDLPLKEDKTISDVLSSGNLLELKSLIDKELPFSNVDLTTPKPEGLPKDMLNDLPVPNTESLSSSKLLITKVLLENVLSEMNQNRFSLPVKKPLSHSELDKTLYFIESTLSDMIEQSSQEEVPYSATNEDVFELCLEKIFPDNPNFDMPADDYPTEQTTKKQSYNLIEQIGDEESKTTFTEKSVDDAGAVPTLIDKALPHSNIDVISLKPKNLPKDTPSNLPLLRNKTLSSSKLPITKALLENVLSEIERKGFSLPVAQSCPVESHSD